MDLTNVETKIYKADGTLLGDFNKTTGAYPVMGLADYFVSLVMSGTSVVAKLGGKVWPVGEPMAVKSVVGDMKTKEGKPNNCIINTAYPLRRQEPYRGIRLPRYGESGPGHLLERFPEPQALQDSDAAGVARSGQRRSTWCSMWSTSHVWRRMPPGLPGNAVTTVQPEQPQALPSVQQDQQLHRQAFGRLQGHCRHRYRQLRSSRPVRLGIEGQTANFARRCGEGWTVMGARDLRHDGSRSLLTTMAVASFSHGLFGPTRQAFPGQWLLRQAYCRFQCQRRDAMPIRQ